MDLEIKTQRLILRSWRKEDYKPFFALNSDPRVMEYFPSLLTEKESDALAQKITDKIEQQGWGFWAASIPGITDFIGFIGLNPIDEATSLPFAPAVEIGWRLAFEYWGQGYATEGAEACLEYGFLCLDLPEIVSFTAIQNRRSRAVMERLGMKQDGEFDHPGLPEGHPLKRHVLYRLSREAWEYLRKKKPTPPKGIGSTARRSRSL